VKNRDKIKDDAIAQLSDQLMALTARMAEIERAQKYQKTIVQTLLSSQEYKTCYSFDLIEKLVNSLLFFITLPHS
jgi:hypothetical protein